MPARRIHSIVVVHVTIMASLALLGCHTRTPAQRQAFFVQMSDPQFGFFTANADFSRETINFERAIAAANRLKPAFVVVCGDLVHRVGDQAQIAEYLRIAATLDPAIPLFNVSGNHDVGQIPTPETLAAYRAKFGRDWYAFERRGIVGVVLNSSLVKDTSGAPAEAAAQERWLRGTLDSLKRAGRTNVMVFQHHPWFLTSPTEPDQYYNLPVERRARFLALFREHGIRHVFAGHYHRNAFGADNELQMVTSGPVGRPMGNDSSGLRIVAVKGNEVTHRYYALDSVPASAPPADSAWLRVMSFNIAAGNGDLGRIAETIRAAAPDIVALQEVDVRWNQRSGFADQAAELGQRLAMHVRFAPIYSLPPIPPARAPREYGVALLSRFPVAAWSNDTLTRLSTQDSLPVPRRMPGLLSATVDVRGTRVRVFSTHTDYRPDPKVRQQQVAEMLAYVGTADVPTLLMGDLNAPPFAPELQPLFARLVDAWTTNGTDGFTYPAANPLRRIDYVLTSRHFRSLSVRVPPSTVSDHRPVIAELMRAASPR